MSYKEKYNLWLESEFVSEDDKKELRAIEDEKEIEDRFYKDLEFGTAGLRGVLGAGSNRMNSHTVGKVSEGLGRYLKDTYESPSCAIAYDPRIKSDEFALEAALILASKGVKVYLHENLAPVPILSYTARYYNTDAGVVITASHNPKEYNGYKVYGNYGGQVIDDVAEKMSSYIDQVDMFKDINPMDEKEAIDKGLLVYIGEEVIASYMEDIKSLTIRKEMVKNHAKDLKIIYTPIHGSGNVPVRRVLKELGYENLSVVKEQEKPDGTFPTAPYPNPEDPKVFKLALEMAEEMDEYPDIIFGTDPDADRIGIIIRDKNGNSKVLTGNQIGMIMTYYILGSLKDENAMPNNPYIIKSIVTTESVRDIADSFDVDLKEALTGFKYFGEIIEENLDDKNFVFGFEESFGYLVGDYVRDKDAVVSAMMLCELALYYKLKGMTLDNILDEVYEKYGYFVENTKAYTLAGIEGASQIKKCVNHFRENTLTEVAGIEVLYKEDYQSSERLYLETGKKETLDMASSNVIKYKLKDGSWFTVRPSGTEPKMKVYFGVKDKSQNDAEAKLQSIQKEILAIAEAGFEL
ncbi:MAG: phospho-sugar mutase [Clostridium sp.]|nr:phospho-sugar mutase [Clostridium sp.]